MTRFSVLVSAVYGEVMKIILTAERKRTKTKGDSSHVINHPQSHDAFDHSDDLL